jgi:hypothetical protein
MALIHASASRGSSAWAKVEGFIAKKCSYMVTKFKPSLLGSRGGGFAVVVQQLLLCLEDVMKHLRLCRNEGLR